MKKFLTAVAAAAATLTFVGAERANAVTYYGNQCLSSFRYVDNAGAEACLIRNAAAAGRYITVTPGAYDYARDGHSALTPAPSTST